MKNIVKDWVAFCEKGIFFEDGYFYTLFMDGITSEEIKEIYQSFPNSENLIERIENFLFIPKSIIANYEDKKKELEKLIRLDFEEREQVLKTLDTFSNSKTDFKFQKDVNVVNTLALDDIWSQSFHDYMRGQKISTEKKYYELYNALYGITYDFDYQLYLYLPLLKTDYSGEYLYRFKRLGGIYAVADNYIAFTMNVT